VRFHHGAYFLETPNLVPLARGIDDLGYAGIAIADHLFFPKVLKSRYTYSPYEDGSPTWPPETNYPDPWCAISAMATATKHLHFTTAVFVAPSRDLITVAKAAGTAAVLSEDRVHMGVGVGWCREEFDATGQPFDARGKRLDDMIPALRALWAGGWVEYHGSHYDVPTMQMNPAPSRPLPIYAGGLSPGAIRRAATLCDGWICAAAHSFEEADEYVARLKKALRQAGRADDHTFRIHVGLPGEPTADDFRRFADIGVTDFMVVPAFRYGTAGQGGETAREWIGAAERFAEEVLQKLE
jgi:probable F420-dependent oxidoreductase